MVSFRDLRDCHHRIITFLILSSVTLSIVISLPTIVHPYPPPHKKIPLFQGEEAGGGRCVRGPLSASGSYALVRGIREDAEQPEVDGIPLR